MTIPFGFKFRFINETRIIRSLKNLFYHKVLLPNNNGCMIWVGARNKTMIDKEAYGYFWMHSLKIGIAAHRFSYQLHNGIIIPNKKILVCHKCDVRLCVAPDHLFLGTHKENTQDMLLKNREARGEKTGTSKLKESDVITIRKLLIDGIEGKEIAKQFNVSKSTISSIKLNENWNYLKTNNENYPKRNHRGEKNIRAKLTPLDIAIIKKRAKSGEKLKDIAREFNVSPCTISAINRGYTWKHIL